MCRRLVCLAELRMALRAAQEIACPDPGRQPVIALVMGPNVGLGSMPDALVCAPGAHTRRRADRSFVLATFHAGPAPAPRVRRDARGWRAGGKHIGRVSQARSARKMPRLGPDPHAQAPGRAATGLPLRHHADTHRRRPGSEGHFLRNKGFTEQEVTLASGVAAAPNRGLEAKRKRAGARFQGLPCRLVRASGSRCPFRAGAAASGTGPAGR